MSKVLSLMNKTFYSNKEIFLGELINNASNALDKIQVEKLIDENILDDGMIIRLVPHKGNKTLSIIDTGIGMSKADLAYSLGVGFYSTYLVAHKVIVTSKHNDHDQYIWESQSSGSFIVTKDTNAQQPSSGTNITLFLKDNQLEYLEETTIKNLVVKNCQHISHPIYLWNTKEHWQLINFCINGIICIYSHVGETMYLWNPTNNEFKVIPPSPFEPLQYGIPLDRKCQGFGYDSVKDDYKVIKHVSLNDAFTMEDFYDPKYATIVEMYSLRRNSWKKLEHDIDLPVCYDDIDKFYFEGMCHWLGYPYELEEAYLVSFDLSNEMMMN
ncbi:molecular chaperone HtpG [Vigna unguiculata]|uniref:Molecular chaperone HtpG n=1 Tax=Vigna unguiculata TaxID=3917 RepID=A0A4D6KVE3_VIGUN|nr:molecular chaperone HtpG [Vigna unguiculata]